MNEEQQKGLAQRDYVILIDKSGSMSEKDCPGGRSRWVHCEEQATAIARTCEEFDSDGIDVIVFGSSVKEYKNVTAEKVKQVFAENSPSTSTNTAGAVKLAFDGYFARKTAGSAKPLTVICFTDGIPDDKAALIKVIVDAANKIDADEELAISFLQVGSNAEARVFLKGLDDDLQPAGAKFDIVDTKDDSEMENISMEEILLEAVTD